MAARWRKSSLCAVDSESEPRRSSQESGYAFLMAMFLVLVMIIASQVALRNLLTEGRRAREVEMIWRGNQYARAIRLYYRKSGHYPKALEDLQTGLPELHFLRSAAYKDPMNKSDDGAWRLIYVNAAGQIIGSVKYATLQQMALMDLNGGQIPLAATPGSIGTPVSSIATSGSNGANNANAQPTPPGGSSTDQSAPESASDNPPGGAGTSSGAAPANGAGGFSLSTPAVNPLSLLKPTGPVDGPVLGAFLTGVGGGTKSDAASIKVLNGGKKYKEWEFIWNPLEDQARAVQQGLSPLGQPAGLPGGIPAGAAGIGNASPPGTSSGFGGTIMQPPTQPQQQDQ